jgi:uncharacterized protein
VTGLSSAVHASQVASGFLGFVQLVRRFGFAAAPEQAVTFLEAITALGPRSMADLRRAALASLAPPPDRRDEFDALFRAYFLGEEIAIAPEEESDETRIKDDARPRETELRTVRSEEGGAFASPEERLAGRSFEPGPVEPALERLRRHLEASRPKRRSFRTVRVPSRGSIDLRRALRYSVRSDGDVPDPPLIRRKWVHRKLMLLIDVSGSMRTYSADHLALAHTVVQSGGAVEVFTIGTRLTRITAALRAKDRATAISRASALVEDWDGGTRIGPTLLALVSVPRYAAFARGAAIVILSDALERGDPTDMTLAMNRLSARAFRLSLATPLAGDPRFRPETAALRAILPAIDDLVDGSGLAPLADFILSLGQPVRPGSPLWRRAS